VKQPGRPIYLDMQATSPMDPRVLDAMLPYMTDLYGNPHSRTHQYGWESERAVEKAREVNILSKLTKSCHVMLCSCLARYLTSLSFCYRMSQNSLVLIPKKLSSLLEPLNQITSVSKVLLTFTRARRSTLLPHRLYVVIPFPNITSTS
jgi:hypothetical protein